MAGAGRIPTIKDVARLAGVGLGTVSRVLNATGPVSADATARVEAAIAALGYRANPNAAALRGRVNQVIGVLVPDLENPAIATVVKAIERGARATGYAVMITSGDRDFDVETQAIMTMVARGVQGMILIPTTTDGAALEEAIGPGQMPVVLLDRDFDVARTRVGRVLVGHDSGMFDATRHLIATGHRRLFLLHAGDNRAALSRQRGFDAALAQAPGVSGIARPCARSASAAQDLVRAALEGARRPDAIIAGHNRMLAGIIAAVGEQDLAIGREISVVTCDRTELAELYSPPIAWIDRCSGRIGDAAIDLLHRLISGEDSAASISLTTDFYPAGSIALRTGGTS